MKRSIAAVLLLALAALLLAGCEPETELIIEAGTTRIRDSAYKGTASKEMVLGMITENDTANDPYKAEFTELVEKASMAPAE